MLFLLEYIVPYEKVWPMSQNIHVNYVPHFKGMKTIPGVFSRSLINIVDRIRFITHCRDLIYESGRELFSFQSRNLFTSLRSSQSQKVCRLRLSRRMNSLYHAHFIGNCAIMKSFRNKCRLDFTRIPSITP